MTTPKEWNDLFERELVDLGFSGDRAHYYRARQLVNLAPEYGVPFEEADARFRESFNFATMPPEYFAPSPAEVLLDLPPFTGRVPLGIPVADRALDGGLPQGLVTVIQGPPGSAKTALGTQAAVNAFKKDYLVACIFKDEGRRAGCIRVGQQLGLERRKLEESDPYTMTEFEDLLKQGRGRIYVPDADASEGVLEKVLYDFEPTGYAQKFLLVDSLQSVRADCAEALDSLREQIEAKMRLLEFAAKRGLTVVVISETNRSFYRARSESQRIAPIAAGAESRSIEYVARVLITLQVERNALVDPVKASIDKNSAPGGEKPRFQLRLDSATARLYEIDAKVAAQQEAEAEEEKAASKRRQLRENIRSALLRKPGAKASDIRSRVKARAQDVTDTLAEMEDEGLICPAAVGKATVYRLADDV